jgi:hypothetical protein
MHDMKCAICYKNQGDWAWQPFGPDEQDTFTLSGNHYRGFPVVKVCDECKKQVEAGESVLFRYRKAMMTYRRLAPAPF